MPPVQRTQRTLLLPLPESPAINISFHNIKLRAPIGLLGKEKKVILKGVTGSFKTGELSAIMGPSGAGKSSLLNILTGFQSGDMTGEVKMDGEIVSPGRSTVRSLSCYIMQDDHLNPNFTTLEIMTIAANLKIGNALPPKAKRLLVEDILDSLGMGSTLYTKCARLSGGQKKRLCIALELIDNPPIMYLDEPTSGLDSSSTTQLVRLLKGLAKSGRNIVCTIHQPSATIFELFDHAYIIADGLCMFQGSPLKLVPYLENIGISCPQYHNPVDFMLDVVSGEFGNFNSQLALAAKDPSWRSPPTYQDSIIAKSKEAAQNEKSGNDKACVIISAPSEFLRFTILLKRNIMQLHRDWTMNYMKLVLHALVGVAMGLIFQNAGRDGDKAISNAAYFLCAVVYQSFTSFMPAVLKFPCEINTLKKEQFNNWYKLRTYFLAFLMTNIPLQMIFSFVFITISYYLTSQVMELDKFLKFSLVSQLTIFCAECFGLALGTAGNPLNGVFWGSVFLAIEILLGGFLAILSHVPRPLYYVSLLNFLRYSYEGMIITMYGKDREMLPCPDDQYYCHFKYPEKLLSELAMEHVNYWFNVTCLSGFCVFFIFNAYFFLRRKIKSK